jgi:hypothetical protein
MRESQDFTEQNKNYCRSSSNKSGFETDGDADACEESTEEI